MPTKTRPNPARSSPKSAAAAVAAVAASANAAAPAHAPSGEKFVLVLQGGGALGAYQAGAYAGLAEAGIHPDWIAGISIGAINAAIIAGNPPETRVARLRAFWSLVSSGLQGAQLLPGEIGRAMFNETSSALAATFGIPGLYKPRLPPAWMFPPGASEALSLYDTAPLLQSLDDHVDFAYLNAHGPRLSIGAVNIVSGNFKYFDTAEHDLEPLHVMASGALPPGFPPVLIGRDAYWDGGLVSNTPLQYVLDGDGPRSDMCVFQVDLFSASGQMPKNLSDVAEREKDIRFSSRTRLNTDVFKELQTLRRAAQRLYDKLPAELQADADAQILKADGCDAAVTIVHLIHRDKSYETQSKDNEFSRLSVDEHWEAGLADVRRTLADRRWTERVMPEYGVTVLDLTDKSKT